MLPMMMMMMMMMMPGKKEKDVALRCRYASHDFPQPPKKPPLAPQKI
jgi:hypothetical protein